MKILYISPRYEGGIGGHAKRVAEKLSEQGHDVKLMQIPHLPIKKLKNPSFVIFGKLKALIDNETYDAVHAWNIPSAFIMKNIKSNKKILSVHGIYSEQVELLHSQTTGKLAKVGEKKAFSYSTKLTTDSKIVQQYYKEKFQVDFIHLPAPLDTKKFKNIGKVKKNPNQIVYVGRDSFEKGIDILKNIESKLNGKVIYCTNNPWSKTMEILKSSKLLIVPSRMESLPQVIKEAFYLKIPVIATNVGGIPEIIQNKKTGILIPSENEPEMISAINSLIEDNLLIEKMTNNAFDFINKFYSWEQLLPKYLQLYEK
ncbi:glycosyltransferase family 4 protein [Nitrosopumilus sp.]|nr:glycosyltransferase family 4 protein [Nitrosopumilus sp.]